MLGEPHVHARHHVRDQASNQAVKGPVLVAVAGPLEDELAARLLDRDVRGQGALELALRPLHLDPARLEGDLHRAGQIDRQLSYPRQLFLLISYQTYAST